MKKSNILSGIFVLLLFAAFFGWLIRQCHIKDFYVAEPGILYTSGQPRGMDYLRLLYRYHIATIVNVRNVYEHRDRNWYNEEVVWTRNNGVNFIEMPIDKGKLPDKKTQERFLTIMANKDNLPVLLHGSGDDPRVAMLLAVWLAKTKKYSAEQILQSVKRILDDKKPTKAQIEFINKLCNGNLPVGTAPGPDAAGGPVEEGPAAVAFGKTPAWSAAKNLPEPAVLP